MQNPLRDVIRLDNLAQARVMDESSASIFVPSAWMGRRVVMRPAPGVTWSAVRTTMGKSAKRGADWEVSEVLYPGEWQDVTVEGGSIRGAVLESSDALHVDRLEGWYDPPEELSIRVRLSKAPVTMGREGLITLLFSLTDERSQLVGQQEVVVGPKTIELAVALLINQEPIGRCRLKASLCFNQQVIDDAQIDVTDFE